MRMWTRFTGMQGRALWDYMKWLWEFMGSHQRQRKEGIDKEGYGNSLAVQRGTGKGLCVFVWVLSMSVMVCVAGSVCLYCVQVFACAPVGNMCSAWLLVGCVVMSLWQPCLSCSAGPGIPCTLSTLKKSLNTYHEVLYVKHVRFTYHSNFCVIVHWQWKS